MRSIEITNGEPLKVSSEDRVRLKQFLMEDHRKALDARFLREQKWRAAIRAYGAEVETAGRWTPYENAPLIEVPLCATSCDMVTAQAQNLVFSTDTPLMARSRKGEFDDHADAVQDLIQWGVKSKTWAWKPTVKEGILDQCQLGTFVFYVPWTQTIRKTDVRKVVSFGPKAYSLSPQEFIMPAGATKDVQAMPFVTHRLEMSRHKLNLYARLNNWTIDDAPAADSSDMLKGARRQLAGMVSTGPDRRPPVLVGNTYCYFDIDDDGEDEDLQVIWNMTSGGIMKIMYHRGFCRPFIVGYYQELAHVPYGMGVVEMELPLQREASEIHNNAVWAMMIRNSNMYGVPERLAAESQEIYPGKMWGLEPGEEIKNIPMGMPNPEPLVIEKAVMEMARERVGVQSLGQIARPGSRQPGMTTLTAAQAANTRFTTPFDWIREGAAEIAVQCLYRIQEQVRAGNRKVLGKLADILGEQKADLVIELMRRDDVELTDALDIELSATSVTVNKEADRQNMVMLATQIWPLYYNVMKELTTFKAHPPFPGADKLADQCEKVINKFWSKILKTFDQISDVRSLTIELDEIQPVMAQLGMEQVPGQINGALQAFQGMNGDQPQGPMQ